MTRTSSAKSEPLKWVAGASLAGVMLLMVPACHKAGEAHADKAHAGHGSEGHDMGTGLHEQKAQAHAHHEAQMDAGYEMRTDAAQVELSQAVMRDQAGTIVSLKDDVAGDRILVIDFIFTSCQTICPVTTSLLVEARKRLADVPGSDLAFVSMSIDANNDTPDRLKAFADRHRADWTFLTGQKAIMDKALNDMDAYSTNPEDHAPMILVGDASSGRFIRMFGLPDPDRVEQEVRQLLMRRQVSESKCTPGSDAAGEN
jgi:protein SCO1